MEHVQLKTSIRREEKTYNPCGTGLPSAVPHLSAKTFSQIKVNISLGVNGTFLDTDPVPDL